MNDTSDRQHVIHVPDYCVTILTMDCIYCEYFTINSSVDIQTSFMTFYTEMCLDSVGITSVSLDLWQKKLIMSSIDWIFVLRLKTHQ